TQLLVMRKDPKLAAQGVGGSGDSEAQVSEELLATQMQILQSRRIVGDALAASGLEQSPTLLAAKTADESVTDYVIDQMSVTRGGEGLAADAHVLNVAFTHSDSDEAKSVLDSIVARYKDFLDDKFTNVNTEAAGIITTVHNELSADLEAVNKDYQDFREKAPLLWSGDDSVSTNIHRNRYEGIQTELSLLSLQVSEAQTRLEVVEQTAKEYLANGASDLELLSLIDEKNMARVGILVTVKEGEAETAAFQSLQPERFENARTEYQALLQLELKEKTLLQEFGLSHPEVINTRQQIAMAKEFLDNKVKSLAVAEEGEAVLDPKDLVNAYVKLLRNDLASLNRRKEDLERLAAEEETKARALVKVELEGETLREKVTRQQALYDEAVDRLREINLAGQYEGIINEVLADAEPGVIVWPSLPICLAIGTLGGLVLGSCGAGIAESQDRSFRSADDLREALELPVLTQVPSFVSDKVAPESELDRMLVVHHDSRSTDAEVFRGLRTSILFNARDTDHKTYAFTSPKQGDGKSTVLANLAIAFAQADRSVLIIDCDLRRPNVHRLFGVENEFGLSDIIADDRDFDEVIRDTEVGNLRVITSGPIPGNPAELLESFRFEQVLARAREEFDFVLLDCPPVLAVSDPCTVAGQADAMTLVVRWSKDSKNEALRAKQMLQDVGANLIGTVVNAFESRGTGANRYAENYSFGQYYAYEQERVTRPHNGKQAPTKLRKS
ncbi:MAG: polysaccharide biosynthesis tyrosine autokinase, partial [Planctomycetota bacterium]